MDHYRTRETCRLCSSTSLKRVIPLNPLPLASPNIGKEQRISAVAPADVWQCSACGFLQLKTVVDPEFQYRGYAYFSGISVGLREHFKSLIDRLQDIGEIGPSTFVFDIGSNDGSLLLCAKNIGARVLGIDPAIDIAARATSSGISTIGDFFTAQKAQDIAVEQGLADVIISANTLANVDDFGDLFEGIDALLAPKGILVIETQYAVDVLKKTLLDVIYHEHLSYFSVAPMRTFLAKRGFELVDAERIAPKGGSIRFYIQRSGGKRSATSRIDDLIAMEKSCGLYDLKAFAQFNGHIAELGQKIRDRLITSKKNSGRSLGFGNSVGCAALIQYFEIGDHLDAVYDDMPLVDFIRTPNRDIPVFGGAALSCEPPTEVLVLAWRYIESIAARQQQFIAAGGRFYRALPDLEYAKT